jgi:hypothetical protein
MIALFVAEPWRDWRRLGLGPLWAYGHGSDAFFHSLPSCLRFCGSIAHHLDPRFTVKAPLKIRGIEKATTIVESRAASSEIPEIRDLVSIVSRHTPHAMRCVWNRGQCRVENLPPQVLFLTEYATVLVFRLRTLTRFVLIWPKNSYDAVSTCTDENNIILLDYETTMYVWKLVRERAYGPKRVSLHVSTKTRAGD